MWRIFTAKKIIIKERFENTPDLSGEGNHADMYTDMDWVIKGCHMELKMINLQRVEFKDTLTKVGRKCSMLVYFN